MEPLDSNILDYTYRGSEFMENFYAGPSHWKFLKQNRQAPSQAQSRTKRPRQLTKLMILNDVRQFNMKANHLVDVHDLRNKTTNKLGRWGQFTLSYNYLITPNVFEGFLNCSLNVNDAHYEVFEAEPCEELDEQAIEDVDENFNFANQTCSLQPRLQPLSNCNHRTPANLFGKYSERFNIKRIRSLSLLILKTEAQHGNNIVKFSEVCTKIRKMFMETIESSSCALTFLGILTDACEEKISLKQGESILDFTIKIL